MISIKIFAAGANVRYYFEWYPENCSEEKQKRGIWFLFEIVRIYLQHAMECHIRTR